MSLSVRRAERNQIQNISKSLPDTFLTRFRPDFDPISTRFRPDLNEKWRGRGQESQKDVKFRSFSGLDAFWTRFRPDFDPLSENFRSFSGLDPISTRFRPDFDPISDPVRTRFRGS